MTYSVNFLHPNSLNRAEVDNPLKIFAISYHLHKKIFQICSWEYLFSTIPACHKIKYSQV